MTEQPEQPEAGVADVIPTGRDDYSSNFAADTVAAYEALSQRVKALEERAETLSALCECRLHALNNQIKVSQKAHERSYHD